MYFSYIYKKGTELTEEEQKTLKDYERILTKAHKRAREVVREASKKAQAIISQTTDFDRDALTKLSQGLQQETTDLLGLYHNSLTQAVQGENQALKSAAVQMEQFTEKEVQAYSQNLQQTLVVSQNKINEEIAQDLEKARAEIAAFKQEQMLKAQTQISGVVNGIALKVFGKAIPMEDQEKLIMESLEEAKKEGLFSL